MTLLTNNKDFRWLFKIYHICTISLYLIFLLCIFMNLYVLLSREDTIYYLRIYHSIVGILMVCCSVVMFEFLYRTRELPKLEEPHEIPTPALIGAVALTIGISVGYLYFIIFNYSYQFCDKLVDAIYNSELWLESCYDVLMSLFSILSLIYIMQRRYYGAIDSHLDKVGRLFINITFSVVWIKVVIYKGYLSHNELCQRKELEGYWCPVMKRHYECSPAHDLHGMQKTWYYLNKGLLNTAIISCASEYFPVLLVSHWLSCGGAEEKAEDILRRRIAKQGVRGFIKNFFSDISRVYVYGSHHYVRPLNPSIYLKATFWTVVPVCMITSVIKWMVFLYYTIDFDKLTDEGWLTSTYISIGVNIIMFTMFCTLYIWSRSLEDDRLDAHHKAHARGDITILFGSCVVLFIKLILQCVEVEYQRVDGFLKQEDAIIKVISYITVHCCLWLQYFSLRRILSLSDRDIIATRRFLPLLGVGGVLVSWTQFGITFFDTSLIKYQLTDEKFRYSATTLICMIFTQTIFPADYLFYFTASGCYLELLQRYMNMGFFQIGTPRLSVNHGHGHVVHNEHGLAGVAKQNGMASLFRAAEIMHRKRIETETSLSSSNSVTNSSFEGTNTVLGGTKTATYFINNNIKTE